MAAKLDSQLAAVEKQLAAGRGSAACGGLAESRDTVAHLVGKDLTADQAATLDAHSARIGAVIGC